MNQEETKVFLFRVDIKKYVDLEDDNNKISQWLDKNIDLKTHETGLSFRSIGERRWINSWTTHFYFKKAEDAVLFKMVWG